MSSSVKAMMVLLQMCLGESVGQEVWLLQTRTG
jgi:hypothetical protein